MSVCYFTYTIIIALSISSVEDGTWNVCCCEVSPGAKLNGFIRDGEPECFQV